MLDPMIAKSTGAERTKLKSIKGLIDHYATTGKTMYALQLKSMRSDDTDAALKASGEANKKFKNLPPTVTAIEGGISKIKTLVSRDAQKGFVDIDHSITSSGRIAIAIGALAALVMIGSALLGFFSITKPMRGLVGMLQRMARGEGVEITGVERKDEIGDTARAVNGIGAMLAEKARREAEERTAAWPSFASTRAPRSIGWRPAPTWSRRKHNVERTKTRRPSRSRVASR